MLLISSRIAGRARNQLQLPIMASQTPSTWKGLFAAALSSATGASSDGTKSSGAPGDQSESKTLRVPGFGMPVDARFDRLFPSAIQNSWHSMGITLREKRMMSFVSDITDKPEWDRKVFDETIVEKWRAEAEAQPDELDGDVVLSKQMFDFCIAELREKAEIFRKTGLVNILDGDLTIVKSDVVLSDQLRTALCNGVKALEDVPDHAKDWHPRSDNMVLDLVHPSLFPVIYGLTKVLPQETVPLDGCLEYIGKGVTMDTFTATRSRTRGPYEWGSFQWLPTDVAIKADGSAKLLGYINNLHPEKHRDLYKTLEDIVGATIPVWEESLSGFHEKRRIVVEDAGEGDWEYPAGLLFPVPEGGEETPHPWVNPYTDNFCNEEGVEDPNPKVCAFDFNDWESDYSQWKDDNRILKFREPREYVPQQTLKERSPHAVANIRDKHPKGLQVIFKLANIHLTPDKPEYMGGSQHVEGGYNEMICASAIYYYDQENITDSHLAFRQALSSEDLIMIPQQNEHASLEAYLGIQQDGPAIQDLGRVLTREGRLLVFPNCLQHQVQPFSLQDKTKPGYRKILAMFLIDPSRRVLSTSNVPPQRRDWWAESLLKTGVLHQKLPPELVDHAIKLVDEFPISWESALEMREKLMDQRSDENQKITEEMQNDTFFFCEH